MAWAWGWGRHGQLGLGGWSDELSPLPLSSLEDVEIEALSLGGRHSLALCADGKVYAWGRDEDGQLGLGAQGAKCEPTPIEALSASPQVCAPAVAQRPPQLARPTGPPGWSGPRDMAH